MKKKIFGLTQLLFLIISNNLSAQYDGVPWSSPTAELFCRFDKGSYDLGHYFTYQVIGTAYDQYYNPVVVPSGEVSAAVIRYNLDGNETST